MPKKSKLKSVQTRFKKLSDGKKFFITLLSVITFAVLFNLTLNIYEYLRLRNEFSKLESTMALVRLNGEEQKAVEKDCYELSVKFSDGPIYCRVVVKISEIQEVNELSKLSIPSNLKLKTTSVKEGSDKLISATYTSEGDVFSCRLTASSNTRTERFASFECGTTVWRPIYPMRDN